MVCSSMKVHANGRNRSQDNGTRPVFRRQEDRGQQSGIRLAEALSAGQIGPAGTAAKRRHTSSASQTMSACFKSPHAIVGVMSLHNMNYQQKVCGGDILMSGAGSLETSDSAFG